MHNILNAWLFLFWFTWFLFFLNTHNIIKLFISSEIIWIVLYVYSLCVGFVTDDSFMYTLSILIITIASIEFSIGFILIIFFKKVFKTTDMMDSINTDWNIIKRLNKI